MEPILTNIFSNELANSDTRYFILDTKGAAHTYADVDFEQYHWETFKFGKVREGDLFVYRRPGKASENGQFYFFGAGRIGKISGDKSVVCKIEEPIAFEKFLYQDDLESYQWHWKARTRSDWMHFFNQYGMNQTSKEDFLHLLKTGVHFESQIDEEEAQERSTALQAIQKGHYAVEDNIAEVKVRAGQSAFANQVKANYGEKCAICGISTRAFLRASHIVPWSIDKQNRLNPANGICLCVMHDTAFDKGFITLTNSLIISLSTKLSSDAELMKILSPLANLKIKKPKKFVPNKNFLQYHRVSIFQP